MRPLGWNLGSKSYGVLLGVTRCSFSYMFSHVTERKPKNCVKSLSSFNCLISRCPGVCLLKTYTATLSTSFSLAACGCQHAPYCFTPSVLGSRISLSTAYLLFFTQTTMTIFARLLPSFISLRSHSQTAEIVTSLINMKNRVHTLESFGSLVFILLLN